MLILVQRVLKSRGVPAVLSKIYIFIVKQKYI